jgi:hypothetical protein
LRWKIKREEVVGERKEREFAVGEDDGMSLVVVEERKESWKTTETSVTNILARVIRQDNPLPLPASISSTPLIIRSTPRNAAGETWLISRSRLPRYFGLVTPKVRPSFTTNHPTMMPRWTSDKDPKV